MQDMPRTRTEQTRLSFWHRVLLRPLRGACLSQLILPTPFLTLSTLAKQRLLQVVTLQDAPVVKGAPIACIGAEQTGLGECYLTYHDGEYRAWPSEGGHCEFAPKYDDCLFLVSLSVGPALFSACAALSRVAHRFSSERRPHKKGEQNYRKLDALVPFML